jgi:carboxylesterase type B
VNFVRPGDPNGKGLAHWPSASEQPGSTFEVGERFVVIPMADDKAKRAFFEEYLMKGKR